MIRNYFFYLFVLMYIFSACDSSTIYETIEDEKYWTYAGTDISNVNEFSVELNAMPLRTGESGKWEIVSGLVDNKVSFDKIEAPKTTFHGLPGESYQLCWHVSNQKETSGDTISVAFNPLKLSIKDFSFAYYTTRFTLSGEKFDNGHWEIDGEVLNRNILDLNSPYITIQGAENTAIKATWISNYGSKTASKTIELQTSNFSEFEALEDLSVEIEDYPQDYQLNEDGHVIQLNLHASGVTWRFADIDQFPALKALKYLQKLDIGGNSLNTLPVSIPDIMSNLRYLDCSHNYISSLPDNIGNLVQLDTLILGHQNSSYQGIKNIPHLPDSFGNLKSLKYLDMVGLDCEKLPDNFANLTELTYLNLFYNNISYLPDNIGKLTKLEYLDLWITCDLPESFSELRSLNDCRVVIKKEGATTIMPDNIGNLNKLTRLTLQGNFTNLPESIGNLKELKYLEISSDQEISISKVPESIGNLIKLETLFLNGKFTELPESFGNLQSLKSVSVLSCLKSLPNSIGNLPLVDALFQNGEIEYLPESITQIESLKYLYLSYNAIKELPESMGNLKNLYQFNLFSNNLKDLPISIQNLSENLGYLNLGKNNIPKDKQETITSWLPKTSVSFN